jgi:CheY-like chemotaxis protein
MGGSKRFDHDFSGKVVLVVEDTMMSFKLLKAVLSQVNASVVHAKDGLQAVEHCQGDQPFDVVIMDIQMPGMDGIEATREIKKICPDLPIIAATANTFDDEERACLEAGCSAYITKPLQFSRLFGLMQKIFDLSSAS